MKMYRVYANGNALKVHSVRTSAQRFNRLFEGKQRDISQTEISYYVDFDFEKPVTLTVYVETERINNVEIRPLHKGYTYCVQDNEITIEVKETGHFTVEVDGYDEVLTVFVNPPEKYVPKEGDLYFGAGEHEAGLIVPKDGQRIYIDRGAIVYGTIYAIGKKGVTIEGRGVLDASKYVRPYLRMSDEKSLETWPEDYDSVPAIVRQIDEGYSDEIIRKMRENGWAYFYSYPMGIITAYGCCDLKISGIILKDSFLWTLILRNACENVLIDNVKIIGQWRYNSDGINICESNNVMVKNCFVRSFDDGVIVRGGYMLSGYLRGCHNITIENNVFWSDWGKVFEIWSGDRDSEIANVRYYNNYAIRVSATVMSIDTWFGSDSIMVKDIEYDHIYVEYDDVHKCEQMQTSDEQKYDENKTERNEVLVYVGVRMLAKNLGNQHYAPLNGDENYRIVYKNIQYRSIIENRQYGKILLKPKLLSEFSDVVFEEKDIAEFAKNQGRLLEE